MQYFEPNFLDEALVVLDRFGTRARVLAGGSILGPLLRADPGDAEAIVNIKRIGALAGVRVDGDALSVGALLTAHELAHHPLIREHAPLLAEAAATLGARQLRSVATLGGNLCSGHHSADLVVALLALDARVRISQESRSALELPIERIVSPGFAGFGGGLITSVEIPVCAGRSAYAKMQTRRAFEMAIVCVAAFIRCEERDVRDARIALGGAAGTPVRATAAESVLMRTRFEPAAIAHAADVAADVDADPHDDARASGEYRRNLVRVLVGRALSRISAPNGKGAA